MVFYPNRKITGTFGLLSIIACAVLLYLSFLSFSLTTAIPSLIFFGLLIFFIFPVVKNQVVDVRDDHIILFNFGKSFKLYPENPYEIVERKAGFLSYRFRIGTSRFQISPCGYYESKRFQTEFSKMFFGGQRGLSL